ncbi:MAG: T9SS type A sorting domain-containing protein [Saprospiraceae bacterium]
MKRLFLLALLVLCAITLCAAQPGTLDQTFGTAGKVTTSFGLNDAQGRAIAIQPDGKIIVVGETYSNTTVVEDFALTRYNANGTPDATFGTNGLVVTDMLQNKDVANAVAIQMDGKIVVAGYAHNGSNYDFAIARYLTNGALDNTFGTNGKTIKNFGSTDFGLAMALRPNGKILVAGRAYNGINSDFALVQLNSDGTFDNSFGTIGAVKSNLFDEQESANAIAIQPDGKIVAVGDRYANTGSIFAAARFNADGSLDNTFGTDGKVSTALGTESDVAYAVAIQADGRIVVAGQSNLSPGSRFALVRYLANGNLDNSFSSDGKLITSISGLSDYAYSAAIQANGKILAGGSVTGSNSNSDFAVACYLPDGNLDLTFGVNGIGLADFNVRTDAAHAMILNQDKIVMAGYSDDFMQSNFAVARFQGGASVGANDLFHEKGIQIFPNPASESVQIMPVWTGGTIRVLSATGQLMADIPDETDNLQINVAQWPSGWYFAQLSIEGKTWVAEKFLVQKP